MKQASAAEIIIGSGDEAKSGKHIAFVNSISERDALKTDGFVFVRNAYLGDKTVHRGWAVYVRGKCTTSDQPHWIKTMEEESVDGLWSVRSEILEVMFTKAEFLKWKSQFFPKQEILKIGSEWTEEDLVRKINEIINVLHYDWKSDIEPIGSEWTEDDLVSKINEITEFVNFTKPQK